MNKVNGLPIKLSKPAQIALSKAGIFTIEQLSKCTEPELAALHGISKTSLTAIRKLLKEMGLSFAG